MKKRVNIHIGEFYASREPTVIYTLLGSCVAVCLFDPFNMMGGMNHILLPGRPDLRRFDNSARYGINAMELLINRIMKLGGDRKRIVAKIFGGAHIISVISRENSVGPKIAEFVKNFLKIEGIKIVRQDLGGNKTRKIFFHTDTGKVYLERVVVGGNFYREYQDRLKLAEKKIKNRIMNLPTNIEIFSPEK